MSLRHSLRTKITTSISLTKKKLIWNNIWAFGMFVIEVFREKCDKDIFLLMSFCRTEKKLSSKIVSPDKDQMSCAWIEFAI